MRMNAQLLNKYYHAFTCPFKIVQNGVLAILNIKGTHWDVIDVTLYLVIFGQIMYLDSEGKIICQRNFWVGWIQQTIFFRP